MTKPNRRCPQCRLEKTFGVCDRKDCSNYNHPSRPTPDVARVEDVRQAAFTEAWQIVHEELGDLPHERLVPVANRFRIAAEPREDA